MSLLSIPSSMKIPKTFPQFTQITALFVTTGKQGAVFYVATNGFIDSVGSFDIPVPHYSDHEGKFARRGRGLSLSSGGVYEPDKAGHIKEFLRALATHVKQLVGKYAVTATYLYAPQYLMKQVKEALHDTIEKSYVMSFQGNYHEAHPTVLLEMVAKRKERRADRRLVVPTKGEAVKLLSRKNNK